MNFKEFAEGDTTLYSNFADDADSPCPRGLYNGEKHPTSKRNEDQAASRWSLTSGEWKRGRSGPSWSRSGSCKTATCWTLRSALSAKTVQGH